MICEESADSEEEILVFAEFEDSVNIENYRSIHVLGISGQNPIIQLDDTIFTGQLESPLGTYMFFAKDPTPKSMDPLFDKLPKESVKYVCKAKKYLKMKHTYITPREGAVSESKFNSLRPQHNISDECPEETPSHCWPIIELTVGEADVRNESPPDEDNLVPLTFKTVQEAVEAFKSEWQSKIQETELILPDSLPFDQDMTDSDYKS